MSLNAIGNIQITGSGSGNASLDLITNRVVNGNYNVNPDGFSSKTAVIGDVEKRFMNCWFYSAIAPIGNFKIELLSQNTPRTYSNKCLRTTSTSPASSTGDCSILHPIEIDMCKDIYLNNYYVLSFYTRANYDGRISTAIRTYDKLNSIVFQQDVINDTTNWNYHSLLIPPLTSATIPNVGVGLLLSFSFCRNASADIPFNSTGQWQNGNYMTTSSQGQSLFLNVDQYVEIADVQINKGSTIIPDIRGLLAEEALARRYYRVISMSLGLSRTTALLYRGNIDFTLDPMYSYTSLDATYPNAYAVGSGSAGTPFMLSSGDRDAVFSNSANNWTTNTSVRITAGIDGELL